MPNWSDITATERVRAIGATPPPLPSAAYSTAPSARTDLVSPEVRVLYVRPHPTSSKKKPQVSTKVSTELRTTYIAPENRTKKEKP